MRCRRPRGGRSRRSRANGARRPLLLRNDRLGGGAGPEDHRPRLRRGAGTRCRRGPYGAGKELSDAPGHSRHRLQRRLGPVVGEGFSARLRGRPAAGGGTRSLRGSAAVQEVTDDRKDDECRLAHQAVLLCRVHPRPDDQSRPGALHGQADGREDRRDQCEPPSADLTTRCDHEPDYGCTRRLRSPTTVDLNWGGRAGLADVLLWVKSGGATGHRLMTAAAMSLRLVPHCFDAVWDPDANAWHLLLEDLTDSHFVLPNWPLPPTPDPSKHVIA